MSDPIDSFAALQLPPALLSALADVGYETPSPIQAACIPPLLAGSDLLGEAQTGTGKTAAFALPVLARLDLALKMPQAMVLTPTRELAIQVAEAFQKYAHHMPGFHVLPLYGGQSMVVQLRALSRGAHVIVGTPGRIMDHLERKSLQLDKLQTLVLDEADEMLRMGFIDDVQWILEHTPATRQTALFSATMPDPIRRIAQRSQRDPQHVKIRSATTTVATTRQRYWQVRGADKLEALTRILEVEEDFEAAIIFVRTKVATVELAEKLEARGYEAAALNGDMTQGLREQVVERLKGGGLDIVVATDVAARGIDVPRISHVINYDVPYDTEAYVHRIGRTGRAGRTGSAILFVAPREMRMLKAIEYATRQKIEPITLPSMSEVADRRVAQFKQQVEEVLTEENLDFFFPVVRSMEEDVGEDGVKYSARQIAAALAFMATRERPLQPEGKDIPEPAAFAPRRDSREDSRSERPNRDSREEFRAERPPREDFRAERTERPPRENREEARSERPPRENREDFRTERSERPRRDEAPVRRPSFSDANLVRYRIEVGRKDGVMPKEIVGAIANEGGIEGRYIGQIHLFDEYTTVELPAGMPAETFAILKRTRVRQKPLNIRLADASDEQGQRPRRPFSGEGKPAFSNEGKPGFAGKDRPPFRSEGKPSFPPKDRPFPGKDRPFSGGDRPFSKKPRAK